jgi:TPR repeat protein
MRESLYYHIKLLAEKGDCDAQYDLGEHYYSIFKDYEKAVFW